MPALPTPCAQATRSYWRNPESATSASMTGQLFETVREVKKIERIMATTTRSLGLKTQTGTALIYAE